MSQSKPGQFIRMLRLQGIAASAGSMKKVLVCLILVSCSLILSCSTPAASRYREGDNTGQKAALTISEEQRLTHEALRQIKRDYPPVKNSELQRYISRLGKKIVTAGRLEGKPYHYDFTVIDSRSVNAFPLPAGKVFITAPLIATASSEAELAGAIGHEVGHIMARHVAERMYRLEQEEKTKWMYAAGGTAIGAAAGFGIGLLVYPAVILGGAAGAGGGLLVHQYTFLANTREDELEADRIGFKLAVRAGYDKNRVGDFYKRLLETEKKAARNHVDWKIFEDALSTHPLSQERVKQMEEMAAHVPKAKQAIVSSSAFARAKQIATRVDISRAGDGQRR